MLPTQLSYISSWRTFRVPSPYEAADWKSLECNSGVSGPLEHKNCLFKPPSIFHQEFHQKCSLSQMDAF